MMTVQLAQAATPQKRTLLDVRSIFQRVQQKLIEQQRNRQMRAAALASYAVWTRRYGARGKALLHAQTLQSKVLPQLFTAIATMREPSPTDAAAALANLLRGCVGEECSSFASFVPELADYVCLFEDALREQAQRPYRLADLAQAA